MSINEDNPCVEARHHYVSEKRARKLDAVEPMIAKAERKKTLRDCDKKTGDHLSNLNKKMIIDFDCESSPSINSLAVNKTLSS